MTRPGSHSFTVTTELEDSGTFVLTVSGDFDTLATDAFDVAAEERADHDVRSVRVDLAGATLIDSTALGALVRLRGAVLAADSRFRVHAPHAYQRRLLEITGLERLLGAVDG